MYLDADNSKCTGCRVCQIACAMVHFNEINPKKTAIGIKGHFPEPGTYETVICNQCGVCAQVCPVEAISIKDNGIYIIDSHKCTGCGVCVQECPRQCMFLHSDTHVPMKCDMCKECVVMCPTKTLFVKEEAGKMK
ncbi:MAG: 4Fe-4S dicluster domain-containing protein [Planctomycetes bacterium]|nr:4Fe-4S dicluster domain-containing protein [Planctomycetota bacterium]